jgi:hypothetical protein
MRNVLVLALVCFLEGGRMTSAGQVVSVTFVHPETYTDADPNYGSGMKAEQSTLTELGRYIELLGARYLGPGQSVSIDVADIDLAGEFEPWRKFAQDVRIMRDVYPPRIALQYRLVEGGRTVAEGRERIVDPNYLDNPATRSSQDPLRYEKALLNNWFQARFVARTAAPA